MRRDAPRLRVTLLRARFGQVGKGCAMRARIADFRSEHMAYVDVVDATGRRLWVFRPFAGGIVTHFVGRDDQLWCLGRHRKAQTEGSEVVRFDLTTGKELSRAWIPAESSEWRELQLFPKSRTLGLIGLGEVAFVDQCDLTPRSAFSTVWTFAAPNGPGKGFQWAAWSKSAIPAQPRVGLGENLAENPDGTVRAAWQQYAGVRRSQARQMNPSDIDPINFIALDGWFQLHPETGVCQPQVQNWMIEENIVESRASTLDGAPAPRRSWRQYLGAGPDPLVRPDGTLPDGLWPPLTTKDIGNQLPAVIPVAGWSADQISMALHDLSARIAGDFCTLKGHGEGLMLTFDVAGELLDEWAFFAKLREKQIDAAAAVRRLLASFAATVRDGRIVLSPEDDTKAGPMGAAMDWLMAQTDDCADELRDFVMYRDGEHDKASVNNLLLPYVAKRDYCDAQAWRLGILVALLYDRDGVSFYQDGKGISSWMQSGVLPAARDRIAPEVFAAHIAAEAADFLTHPDVFAAFGTHADTLSNSLQSLDLDLGRSAWDLACRTALVRAFPDMIDATPLSEPRQLSVLEKFSDAFFRLWNSK